MPCARCFRPRSITRPDLPVVPDTKASSILARAPRDATGHRLGNAQCFGSARTGSCDTYNIPAGERVSDKLRVAAKVGHGRHRDTVLQVIRANTDRLEKKLG
jgi:hypothetical protein